MSFYILTGSYTIYIYLTELVFEGIIYEGSIYYFTYYSYLLDVFDLDFENACEGIYSYFFYGTGFSILKF